MAETASGGCARSSRVDLAGLMLAFLFGLPALFYPFGRDQALHAYVGTGLLLGEVPYRDNVEIKPVGIFLAHALVTPVLGQVGIRALELVTLLLLAFPVARLARGADVRGWIGPSALAIVAFHYTAFDYWDTAQTEVWEGGLLAAAAAVVVGRDDKSWTVRRAALAGALCATAFLFKFPAALPAVGIGALAVVRGRGLGPRIAAAGSFVAAGAGVVAACILPFAWVGALPEAIDVLYTYLSRYVVEQHAGMSGSRWFSDQLFGGNVLVVVIVAGGGWTLAAWRHDVAALWRAATILGLLGLVLAMVPLQGLFFIYHYSAAPAFFAALAIWGLAQASHGRDIALVGAIGWAASLFLIAPRWGTEPAMTYRGHVARLVAYQRGAMSRSEWLGSFGGSFGYEYREQEQLGRLVGALAEPGDGLCVHGFEPTIYHVSGLRCPARFEATMWGEDYPDWQAEYRSRLAETRPAFLVMRRGSASGEADYAPLRYEPVAVVGRFIVLRRPQTAR